jgi:hypothetical protein
MATTDFLPVAASTGSNVVTQGSFAGSAWQLNGFITGTAHAAQANKIWRQASMFSAAWASLIVSNMATDVLDDGNLPNLATKLSSLVTQLATAVVNGSGLYQRMATAESNIIALQNGASALAGRVTTLESQVASLLTRMGTAEGNIGALQTSVANINYTLGQLQSTVTGNSNAILVLQGQVTSLLTRMSGAESNINVLFGQTSSLDSRVTTAQNGVNANTGQINTINGQIPPINAHLGTLDSQVSQLNAQFPPINNHLSTLDSQVAALMPTSGTGWVQLPNGIIMQWSNNYSQDSGAAEVTRTVSFPRSFPNACLSVQVSTLWVSGAANQMMIYTVASGAWNASNVSLYRARSGSNSNTVTVPIIFAVGY